MLYVLFKIASRSQLSDWMNILRGADQSYAINRFHNDRGVVLVHSTDWIYYKIICKDLAHYHATDTVYDAIALYIMGKWATIECKKLNFSGVISICDLSIYN